MAIKFLLFVSILLVAAPLTRAQLGGLLGFFSIQGSVSCTVNGNANGTATPAFPNALVQLQCGSTGTVVSSATTNGAGVFSILIDVITMLLSSLLNNCRLVVNTPLSSCNSSLPGAGILQSPLQLVGRGAAGLLSMVNLRPAGFIFIPSN